MIKIRKSFGRGRFTGRFTASRTCGYFGTNTRFGQFRSKHGMQSRPRGGAVELGEQSGARAGDQ